jgi:hypothetical protein
MFLWQNTCDSDTFVLALVTMGGTTEINNFFCHTALDGLSKYSHALLSLAILN